MSLRAGDHLDRYKLVAPVGEGGQGSVWKAIDEGGDRLVALKLHRLSREEAAGATRLPSQESEETHRERLRREAQALRQLDHPSLVRCLGMFEDYERDVLGLVLEWIEGSTLTVAARAPTMTDEHRMWVLGHLVRALGYMHQSGMVHRDLKFSNVLVSPMFWQYPSEPATIKLVDLGVAAPVGNPDPLTRAGGVVGTVAYLAPERVVPVNGQLSGATTASDVFAFGVLGWRLLTGQHPAGLSLGANVVRFLSTYELCLQGSQPWPIKGAVEGPWGDVLRRCLPLRPENRLDSAVAVVDLLDGRRERPSVPVRLPGAHVTAPLRQYEGAPSDAPRVPTAPDDQMPTTMLQAYPGPGHDQLPTTMMPAIPGPMPPPPVPPSTRAPAQPRRGHETFLQPVKPPSPEAWNSAPPPSFVAPPTASSLYANGIVPPGMAPPGMAPPGMVPPGMMAPGMMPPGMMPPVMAAPVAAPSGGSAWKVIVGVAVALLVAVMIAGGAALLLR